MYTQEIQQMNTISQYLAKRDLTDLTEQAIQAATGQSSFDCLILLGSASIESVRLAEHLITMGLTRYLLIVGGIGHSTQYLVEAVKKHMPHSEISLTDKSEAEIMESLLADTLKHTGIPYQIETKSTNCGNNATYARQLIEAHQLRFPHILLIQDPTMQRRSHASFEKEWQGTSVCFYSYAPYVPNLVSVNHQIALGELPEYMWSLERYIGLIIGEIQRLWDTEQGYGPRGKGFIDHVEVPNEVIACYEALMQSDHIEKTLNARNR